MSYQVLSEDGLPLDAHFDVEGETIIFHSRGGTKGKSARNVDYARGLRLLLQRLVEAGHPVQRAWVDSNRVQSIPIADRTILTREETASTPDKLVSLMASRMQNVGRSPESLSDHGNATKRIRLEIAGDVRETVLAALRCLRVDTDFRSEQRLPVKEVEKVTAEHLFNAIEALRDRVLTHNFGESTDYDLVLDDGMCLPPKAVFGLAATAALGHPVGPRHFSAGLDSICFRILQRAGYRVVAKTDGHEHDAVDQEPKDLEWREGTVQHRSHLRRERASGLSEAKKAEFRRSHGGRLFCERCGEDPVSKYGTEIAESCIEVHHDKIAVSDMDADHRTRLSDLKCLCANCHRLVHREMRDLADN